MTIKTRRVDITINEKLIKKDFEIPESWSNRAATIVATKYAMDYENSVLDIINRVVDQVAKWGVDQGYFTDKLPKGTMDGHTESDIFCNDLWDILIDQRAAFNSPVWFNCGVKENSNQMSACFIFPVEDNMEDILDHATREGIVFRAGSGAGVNVSKLRGKGEKLANKGEASGPLSFMKVWDANAGSIKSGGKNRRSAKMVCMDVDHPDILDFIECKKIEEDKAKILIANGTDPEEAYTTVAFQNTNHSIRVTDEFMKAVKNQSNWDLYNRGDLTTAKTIEAGYLLAKTARIAWETGDPGIQFDDAMNRDNPVPSIDRINSTNPCSEFSAIDNSSCNLASLNLVKYWGGEEDGLDWALFEKDIGVLVTAMDILIDVADYPTPEVATTTHRTRPLGLGFSNLGAYLMLKGLPYDSSEAREEAKEITRYMTACAYDASIGLAKKLGSFEAFKDNKDACADIAARLTGTDKTGLTWKNIKKHGLRNSQLTLLAPTGTISFMMDCDTTGIEPLYGLETIKTLVGGGTITMTPNCVQETFNKIVLGSIDSRHYQEDVKKRIESLNPKKQAIFATANEISWKGHIDMMAACQQHLNGAISKTVNLPSDCTVEDIVDTYMYAWESGIKAIAIYRNGSKGMQPLTEVKEEKEIKSEASQEEQWTPVRRKLEDTCYGPQHKFNVSGFKGYINVGTYADGKPGQIFIIASKSGSTMQGLLDAFATSISIGLQYGVPLEKLIEKFSGSQFDPRGITANEDIRLASSIIDYIFRWLQVEFFDNEEDETNQDEPIKAEPIKEVILDGPSCPYCGGLTQKSGTCYLCKTCGETTGCS